MQTTSDYMLSRSDIYPFSAPLPDIHISWVITSSFLTVHCRYPIPDSSALRPPPSIINTTADTDSVQIPYVCPQALSQYMILSSILVFFFSLIFMSLFLHAKVIMTSRTWHDRIPSTSLTRPAPSGKSLFTSVSLAFSSVTQLHHIYVTAITPACQVIIHNFFIFLCKYHWLYDPDLINL